MTKISAILSIFSPILCVLAQFYAIFEDFFITFRIFPEKLITPLLLSTCCPPRTKRSIEYRSDDITKKFFAFQWFGYLVSVEHGEKHLQPKFGGNRFMGARDMAA